MGTSKQDRQGARTAQDIERKYNFGESFAEVYGIANGAREVAEEAKKTAEDAKDNPNLDHESVFNALTEDGKCQGLFRDSDGNIYINAEFIKTGVFKATQKAKLPPSRDIAEKVTKYLTGSVTIPEAELPLYDINGNGVVDATDASILLQAANGEVPAYAVPGIVETDVTVSINPYLPEEAICIEGKNMWGETLHKSIGTESAFLDMTESGYISWYKNYVKYWLNPPMNADVEYRTLESINGRLVFKKYDSETGRVLHKHGSYGWYDALAGAKGDCVVEYGTVGVALGTWYYRKYASGFAEADLQALVPLTATGNINLTEALPVAFTGTPVVIATLGRNGVLADDVIACNSSGNLPDNLQVLYLCVRGVKQTGYDMEISIRVSGQWK